MNYDINLLPKSDKGLSGFDMFLIVLIIFAIILAVAYAGFYLPLSNKARLSKEIANKEKELERLNEQLVEYTDLVNLVSDLEAKFDIIKALQKDYFRTSLFLSYLEQSLPDEIVLKSVDIDGKNAGINGISPNLNLIAQFIVNLRNHENISDVIFTEARLSESEGNYGFKLSIVIADIQSGENEEGADAE
ncbi:MAG TPA: PilN domain-containing protein [Candidatus Atribacteria bacterium]|nr:PilN domain-containing protein [Candidatus Atribacteria bacterium]